jgi:hypothetical protein
MRLSAFPLDDYPSNAVAGLLLQLVQAGALELRIHPPKIAASMGNHPMASALARAMVAEGYRTVTNQRHTSIKIGDEISRRILSLLDGSRDLRALARDLSAAGADPRTNERGIKDSLAGMHRLSLLTG